MPVWSRDGRKLFFVNDQDVIVADLSFGAGMSVTG